MLLFYFSYCRPLCTEWCLSLVLICIFSRVYWHSSSSGQVYLLKRTFCILKLGCVFIRFASGIYMFWLLCLYPSSYSVGSILNFLIVYFIVEKFFQLWLILISLPPPPLLLVLLVTSKRNSCAIQDNGELHFCAFVCILAISLMSLIYGNFTFVFEFISNLFLHLNILLSPHCTKTRE